MNFYEALDVDEDADSAHVKRRYRELARRYHPDVNDHPQASEQFKVLTKARDVLTDSEERNAYDRLGHADYVEKRIDGDFPDPEMVPDPSNDADRGKSGSTTSSGTDTSSSTTSGSTGGSSTSSGATASTGTSSTTGSSSTSTTGPSGTGTSSSTGSTASTGSSGSSGGSSGEGSNGATSSSSRSTGSGSSPSGGSTSGGTASDASTGRSTRGGRSRGSGASHSTPPTPGEGEGDGDSGGQGGGGGPTPGAATARRASQATARLGSHFTASRRWVAVLVTAATYFAGVNGYLQANGAAVDQLVAALTSGDPERTAAALASARYGVPDVLAYAGETGLLSGLAPSSGILLVVGALVLPPVLAGAVTGLREETTWRPSWLHVVGGVGPLASVGVVFFGGNSTAVPFAALPLLVDLLVLVVLPAVVVASFLVNRLVVVFPLQRLEDLGGE